MRNTDLYIYEIVYRDKSHETCASKIVGCSYNEAVREFYKDIEKAKGEHSTIYGVSLFMEYVHEGLATSTTMIFNFERF